MSIFFDFDVGPTGRRFRRAVDEDKHDIQRFVDDRSDEMFGEVDIGHLIELSALSICMINENKEVIGFMALSDYPNVRSVDPADSEMWLRNMFQRFYLSRNSFFIHYMCCAETVEDYFMDEALVSVFKNDSYLHQILLVVPPKYQDVIECAAVKRRNVFKFRSKNTEDLESCLYLYSFSRQVFCPKIKMRRAVEEDNDDIVEILDKKCPRLKELYGSYYVSEIVARHPDSKRRIIVADDYDHVGGVMCINSDVNYEKLDAMYELRPFYGLKKATPMEKEEAKRTNELLKTFGEPIMCGEWSPFQRMIKTESIHAEDEPSRENINIPQAMKTSKVYFERNASFRKSFEHIIMTKRHQSDDYSDKVYVESPTQSQTNVYCITELLEEDPFDYEIVNIDSDLLTIPEALSCEQLPIESQLWRQKTLNEIKHRRLSRGSLSYKNRKTEETEVTVYNGEPNAFMIELCGFSDNVDDRYAYDLLEAAFEMMKDLDYCIIRVPCKDKVFPLLQHFCFVPTKPKICSKYALYVAHRASVLGKLRVRPAEIIDIPQIAQLLRNLEAQETIWTIEHSILNKSQYYAYVLISGFSVVGVGILEPPDQTDFIRAKYNLDRYHNHKYHYRGQGVGSGLCTLKAAIAYQAFEVHYRYFAREMMRLSGNSSIFWLTAYRNKWVAHKANSLASAMIPLIPRKSEIDCTKIPQFKSMSDLSHKISAFSTWFLSTKTTTIPKVDINTRILIVGASRTAMAFLDTLLFSDASTYLSFTHVTLISPNGLPYTRQVKPEAEMMFQKYRTSADKFMKSVPYTYYTNIVQGTMVEINKRDKYITLSNGNKYYYDMLVLLLGKQYQHPDYLQDIYYERDTEINENTAPYVRLDVPRRVDSDSNISTQGVPDNVFIVNNVIEANKALKYVKNVFWQDHNYKVLVYGASITAYCCISALLKLDVPAQSIVFIEPFPCENEKSRVSLFCNENVDQSVREVLNNLNITVYRSYYFQSWVVDEYNMVTHVEFISYFQKIKLECSAFFYYGKIGVSAPALNAIRKSGLVYDGGILIDHQFRTKDPYIYAAGTATRYYRRYYANTYRLKYYDSYEVGEMLGNQIRNQLDPLFTPKGHERRNSVRFSLQTLSTSTTTSDTSTESTDSKISSESSSSDDKHFEKLPKLTKPIVTHCILPGNLQYLEVRPPGKKIPHYYVQSKEYTGYVMETFKGGYFKIHLNNDHIVDGITCLSPDQYSLDNFKNLYGLSTNVLNNVQLRYMAKKVDNFYSFFRAEWAFYLYHDRCDELFAMARELLPKGQTKGTTLKDALRSIGSTLSNPSYRFNTRMRIRSRFEQSPHVEAITDYVMDWLSHNDVLLPMYLQNEHMTELAHDLGNNPIFVKKRNSFTKMLFKIF